jgi:hypothetical protein
MPELARITLYPIKSLDGVSVPEAVVLPSGALQHDRRFEIRDEHGQLVNGKRTPKVHAVRAEFDSSCRSVTLHTAGVSQRFHLDSDREELELWLSVVFGARVTLAENKVTGFPDDLESPGPTVIGTETLAAVAGWFPGMSIDEARQRFRANLEIEGWEPFGEDRLVPEELHSIWFRIGEVLFEGTNPCQRCVVPTRSPTTGAVTPDFVRIFSAERERALPPWAPRTPFDHFYRLAVNTRAAGSGMRTLRVGDSVQLLDKPR